MGLKHLTLGDSTLASLDWSGKAVGSSSTVSSLGDQTVAMAMDDQKMPSDGAVVGLDSYQFSGEEDSDELDDMIMQELLSMDDDKNSEAFSSVAELNMGVDDGSSNDVESFLAHGLNGYFGSDNAPASVVHQAITNKRTAREIIRERRKKDVHNMIERRRRYHINDRIKELATLLPKSWREEMKLNKGTILKASVDYIRLLHRNQNRIRQVIEESRSVKSDNSNMIRRIGELENLLKFHRVPVPPPPLTLGQAHKESNNFSFGTSTVTKSPASVSKTAQLGNAFSSNNTQMHFEPAKKVARTSVPSSSSDGITSTAASYSSWEAIPYESSSILCNTSSAGQQASSDVKEESKNNTPNEDFMSVISPITPLDGSLGFSSEAFSAQNLFSFTDIFLQ